MLLNKTTKLRADAESIGWRTWLDRFILCSHPGFVAMLHLLMMFGFVLVKYLTMVHAMFMRISRDLSMVRRTGGSSLCF